MNSGTILESINQARDQQALFQVSRQVAHDLRSPLSALKILVGKENLLPEAERCLVASVLRRMESIATDLVTTIQALNTPQARALEVVKSDNDVPRPSSGFATVLESVEQTASVKRMEFSEVADITFRAMTWRSRRNFQCEPQVLERILCNLINNSVEAAGGERVQVEVQVARVADGLRIDVIDNGVGMPPDLVRRIGTEGVSSKASWGCGLWHAKKNLRKWGGKLTIASRPGRGTKVSLVLPVAQTN